MHRYFRRPRSGFLALILLMGGGLLTTPEGEAAQQVFRYLDPDGTVVLSDQPPPGFVDSHAPRGQSRRKQGRRGSAEVSPRRTNGAPANVGATFTIVPGPGGRAVAGRGGGGMETSVSYEYYPVGGTSAASAVAAAGRTGPMDEEEARRYPAQTQWSIGWSYDYEYFVTPAGPRGGWIVSAEVRSVRVAQDVRVVLPRPEEAGSWTEADWAHWDAYIAGLREHEDYHVRIVMDPRVEKGIVSDLSGLYEFEWQPSPAPPSRAEIRTAVEEEVYELGSRWIELVKSRNDEYDRITGHGRQPAPGEAYLAALGLRGAGE